MRLVNHTDGNIGILRGIFVPANNSVSVEIGLQDSVRKSALVKDYVSAGSLEIVEDVVPETAPTTSPAPKPAAKNG